jgi:hypothetical protein
MKLVLLVATLVLVAFVTVVETPVASACPDPDNPCDPMPICTGGAVACLKQVVGCVAYRDC